MFGLVPRRFAVSPFRRFLLGTTGLSLDKKPDGGGVLGVAKNRQRGAPGAAALDERAQRLAGQQGAVGGEEQEKLRLGGLGARG